MKMHVAGGVLPALSCHGCTEKPQRDYNSRGFGFKSQLHQLLAGWLCVAEPSFFNSMLFIYFWLRCGFVPARASFQLRWAGTSLHCGVRASHRGGLSFCGARALGHTGFRGHNTGARSSRLLGSRARAPNLWPTDSAALQPVRSSQTRDWTRLSCIARWIPQPESPFFMFKMEIIFTLQYRCICKAESLCCSPEIITALLIGYPPIQTKKFFFF